MKLYPNGYNLESVKVEFHRSGSGRSYFEDFLKEIPKSDRAAILAVFQDIQTYGFNALGCEFRQIARESSGKSRLGLLVVGGVFSTSH